MKRTNGEIPVRVTKPGGRWYSNNKLHSTPCVNVMVLPALPFTQALAYRNVRTPNS